MRFRPAIFVSALLLSLGAPAFAADPQMPAYPACPIGTQPSERDAAAAYDFYKAGKRFFDERDLLRAIEQFSESYKRDCTKYDLLVTIARAYELHGDRAQAIHTLKAYLARVPDAPDADTQRKLIANLERDLADENAKRSAERKAIEEREAEKRRQEAANAPAEMRTHTVAPWIVVGAGAVVGVSGLVMNVATSYPDKCEPGKSGCTNISAAEATQTIKGIGVAMAITGGAAIVGGLLWHFLEPTGPVEKKSDPPSATSARKAIRVSNVSVAPTVGPEAMGLSFAGRF